jgi:hypothetical protein
MRISNGEHTSRPWRIHELTRDFRLEDVWELLGVGGPDDFPRLVQLIASFDPSHSSSPAARSLFAIRSKLGELLGLDAKDAGFRARMAVLVNPNGLLGAAYMAAIKPFRYLIVYPAIMRQMARSWQAVTPFSFLARRLDVTLSAVAASTATNLHWKDIR